MSDINDIGRSGPAGNTAQMDPPASSSPGAMKDQAGQAASTAVDEGKHVTAVAGEEAQKVAAEAKQQTRALVDDAKTQLEEQSRTQRDRVVQTLTGLGDDLGQMSQQGGSGLAADLVQQAADRVHALSSRLDGREPAELLGEVRDFARRKPGTFLLGALAAGVVAGRLARGAQKSNQQTSPGSATSTGAAPAAVPTTPASATTPVAPVQRASSDATQAMDVPRTTPTAPAMATFPPDQPGQI